MKSNHLVFLAIILTVVLGSCQKEDKNGTGTLTFIGVSEMPELKSAIGKSIDCFQTASNTYTMHTANLKLYVAEIWVSKGLVTDGVSDNFDWYKIGEGEEQKYVDEYTFTANNLPEGDYCSIKMVFQNNVTRLAAFQSDINTTIEMEGSLNEENCGDGTLITQYFSTNGNHNKGDDGRFILQSYGETIRGFKVKANETTIVYWKLGGANSSITDCTFDWVDVNSNLAWDCGLDYVENFDCVTNMPMWTFGVDDSEDGTAEGTAQTITDIDGNTYNIVQIGTQTWMKENLKTTKLNDGTSIPYISDAQEWVEYGSSLYLPAQYIGYDNADIVKDFGRVYNWHTVATGKLCPSGWHVPNDNDWNTLVNSLGGDAGGKLKEVGTGHWQSPNTGATNESNFSARGGGLRAEFGEFILMGNAAFFWSATELDSISANHLELRNESDEVERTIYDKAKKEYGMSCRCLKD